MCGMACPFGPLLKRAVLWRSYPKFPLLALCLANAMLQSLAIIADRKIGRATVHFAMRSESGASLIKSSSDLYAMLAR